MIVRPTGRFPPMNLGIPRFPQQRANRLEPETALKLEKIMKRNGIITIDNVEHKTEIKDLEDMGELGNGTSGHVVKMKHKLTDKVIAVKVCSYIYSIATNRADAKLTDLFNFSLSYTANETNK